MPALKDFAKFVAALQGDEKSEAQTYIMTLLHALGHPPGKLPEGSRFEYRVRFHGQRIKYADFVWGSRCLIEMKSRREKLTKHYQQTFDYWLHLVPHRPAFVILCNFDELWIYDFNAQLQEPMDRLKIADLHDRKGALAFLTPDGGKPQFRTNTVDVTRAAATAVGKMFQSLVQRGEEEVRARRFALQSVVSMFAEDIGLLPQDIFTKLLLECKEGGSTYDNLGALFRQMNDEAAATHGRFKGVDYFNGGLFEETRAIELTPSELDLLIFAAREHNWSAVHPVIFGSLFEASLDPKRRHIEGAHFTYEADIQKIIRPTIVKPWDEKIDKAANATDLLELLKSIRKFRVLDPACGSGNFLFVAFIALRELEQKLLLKLFIQDRRYFKRMGLASGISPLTFFGIDKNEHAVEVAKVTLMLARRLAHRYSAQFWETHREELPGMDTELLELESDLPLDNLKENIVCADALFSAWPEVDVIIGNPPYQSKNKMQGEFGAAYSRKVRRLFPNIPGRADYCVYWFRKAHDHLRPGMRAGLVGTNTIRQNYSRIGGLDYIVANGGTITDAVASQVWSGDAVVNVSIVNWIKGDMPGKKSLFEQCGDKVESPWLQWLLPKIPSSLTATFDVTLAAKLSANAASPLCKQGQTPGHMGFVLSEELAKNYGGEKHNAEVLFPYLIGRTDLLGLRTPSPTRWVIDFGERDIYAAARYTTVFKHVQERVLASRQRGAVDEGERNEVLEEESPDEDGNQHHKNFLSKWWRLSWRRSALMRSLSVIPRYIVCVRVTKRPIFEFVSSGVHPSDALTVFAAADDYTFGILQSPMHWTWFNARCSSLKRDPRYTSETVFDTFPWPRVSVQDKPLLLAVAKTACKLRKLRVRIMQANGWTLRELYRTMELPGDNELRRVHQELDQTVRSLYGMPAKSDALQFLFELNQEYAQAEAEGEEITPPGLPNVFAGVPEFFSTDCIDCPVL